MTADILLLPPAVVLGFVIVWRVSRRIRRPWRESILAGSVILVLGSVSLALTLRQAPVSFSLPFIAAILLAGVWLVALGWRGRLLDNHPWCRKCRFDLFGLTQGVERCPECGAKLGRPRAVVLGRRRRKWVTLAAGALIFAAAASIGVAKWWDQITSIEWDWNAYKPDWWLVRNLKSVDADLAGQALRELVERDWSERLSAVHRASLIDHLFEQYVSELRSSRAPWGLSVAAAWRDGSLTRERQVAYARLVAQFSLDVPGRPVAQNAYLPVDLACDPGRGGQRPELMRLVARLVSIRLAGTTYDVPSFVRHHRIRQDGHGGGGSGSLEVPVLCPPGEYTLETVWRIECGLEEGVSPPVLVWEEPLSASITVTQPGPLSAAILTDSDTAERIRRAVKITAIGLRQAQPGSDEIDVIGLFDCAVPDILLALSAQIQSGGENLGGTGIRDGWAGPMLFHFRLPRGREIETLDFVLTPYKDSNWPVRESQLVLDESEEPLDPRPHWFGPAIHIRNVPLVWFDDFNAPGVDPIIVEKFRTSLDSWIETWPERRDR